MVQTHDDHFLMNEVPYHGSTMSLMARKKVLYRFVYGLFELYHFDMNSSHEIIWKSYDFFSKLISKIGPWRDMPS